MKFMACLFILVGLIASSAFAHAEGNCPQGYYPIGASGQSGPQGCAPIPGSSQSPSQTKATPMKWSSTWGAIAIDATAGSLGSITGAATRNEAEESAIADCKTKGGSNCKLQISYANGCSAVVLGDSVFNVNSGATSKDAAKKGMDMCNSQSKNCHVFYSVCSLPKQIQ